jgi:hypothetical protein
VVGVSRGASLSSLLISLPWASVYAGEGEGVCLWVYVRRPHALVLLWGREKKLKYNRQVCGVIYDYITGGGKDGIYMCYVRCFH